MTPKEKAEELYYKILEWQQDASMFRRTGIISTSAKRCALIAVDEIIQQYKTPVVSHIVTAYRSAKDFNENFLDIEKQLKDFISYQILWWQQVKQEIEQL